MMPQIMKNSAAARQLGALDEAPKAHREPVEGRSRNGRAGMTGGDGPPFGYSAVAMASGPSLASCERAMRRVSLKIPSRISISSISRT